MIQHWVDTGVIHGAVIIKAAGQVDVVACVGRSTPAALAGGICKDFFQEDGTCRDQAAFGVRTAKQGDVK